jgi:hypothetical protein
MIQFSQAPDNPFRLKMLKRKNLLQVDRTRRQIKASKDDNECRPFTLGCVFIA